MTKLRTPDSIEDTVSLAIGLLGEARCCEVTGRKPSLVKAWADPDDDKRAISLRACVALDRELLRTGHEAIFSRFLVHAVAPVAFDDEIAGGQTPLDHAMRVVGVAADTLEDTNAALRDGTIDSAERVRISGRIVSLMQQLGQMKRSLFQKSKAARAPAR